MESLVAYSIPFSGLKDGLHLFDYQIDKSFFECFPETPITDGNFQVHVEFNKKPSVVDLLIDFKGMIYIPRELETINIAKYIYEFICLAIPLIKTHDLVPDVECDESMRSFLEIKDNSTPEDNQLWNQLKDIKLN